MSSRFAEICRMAMLCFLCGTSLLFIGPKAASADFTQRNSSTAVVVGIYLLHYIPLHIEQNPIRLCIASGVISLLVELELLCYQLARRDVRNITTPSNHCAQSLTFIMDTSSGPDYGLQIQSVRQHHSYHRDRGRHPHLP